MEENKNKQEEMENRAAVELTEQEERSVVGGQTRTCRSCSNCGRTINVTSSKCPFCGKNPK